MKKIAFIFSVIALASLITLSLNALLPTPVYKQDRRIMLNVSVQETELILKALGKLPTEEAGGLYFNVQYQAQTQLAPPPKKDTTKPKSSKP